MSYKLGLVKTLVDRVFKINNSWKGFHDDINKLSIILRKNCFPVWVIDKIVNRYVSQKLNPNTTSSTKAGMPTKHYYKLPYVGNFSRIMQKKITKLLKRYCKPDLDIKLVFTTFKLRNLFGVKDFVPQSLRSRVVYKFQCASCNACYIGETTRHLSTRIREHLVSDKSSHIYKHLQESETCKNSCSAESFTILDYATSKFQIKIKEALYIKWDNPSLNRQLKKLDLSLSF